ncbi:MAG TPA: methyltransferase [Thermoanaerobaculia bacterium]|nr:methyltransferase [Thermoanaerobaculia bacterium]
MQTFFGSAREDDELERANQEFWRCLLHHARAEMPTDEVRCLLDIGCHRGGLLDLLTHHYHPERLLGLEPLAGARERAIFRLKGRAPAVQILDTARWPSISSTSVDLVTCHEVLHLIADLQQFMADLSRIMRPGAVALVALGSHAENPVWQQWKPQLLAQGHVVFDHFPLDILSAASAAGFHTGLQPLRRQGWVIYDPRAAEFKYPSVGEMLDHQYRHKLLFRLIKKNLQTETS